MAHLTNPSGFRPGKSFLWSNNSLTTFSNTQVALDSHINLGAGLEKTLNNLLKKRKYWLVKSSLKYNIYAGNIPTLKILYYPLFYSVPRQNRLFPLFSEPRRLVHGIKKYTPRLKKFIKKFWKYKKRIYKNRLVYSKKKKI